MGRGVIMRLITPQVIIDLALSPSRSLDFLTAVITFFFFFFFFFFLRQTSIILHHLTAILRQKVLASLSYKFLFLFLFLIFSLSFLSRARTKEVKDKEKRRSSKYNQVTDKSQSFDQSSSSKTKTSRTMSPTDIIRTFFLSLCHFIIAFDGDPHTSPGIIQAYVRLRDALHAHEVALGKLIPLESSETDEAKRFPLSQSLYRGWETNATIIRFIMDCLDTKRHPGGVRKKRMRAVFLATQIEIATSQLQAVLYEYESAK